MKIRSMSKLALVGAFAVVVAGAVTVDDQGVGFVGKGDIQDLFGWNNAQLQANAGGLQFRFSSSETVEWTCSRLQPGGGKKESTIQTQTRTTTQQITSNVAYDARKNKQGQITGFNLNGFSSSDTTSDGPAAGSCPAGGGWSFDEGSIHVTDSDEGGLQVSAGGADWYDLAITVD